ncbi:sugar transferase [Novipirellula artificiosorum]|nr:sugar transferase [Novipirellula artificiosorum]
MATLSTPMAAECSLGIQCRATPTWKRLLDLCGVVALFPLLLPVLTTVAIYIKFVSRGPIFFVQSRVGFGGDRFRIYKFRTMHVPTVSRDEMHRKFVSQYADAESPLAKPKYENELIPGGNLIRKLSLDELPQVFNVLIGNMCLVGPRPDVLMIEDYQPWQLRRFEVMPGMTGLWQVSGKNRLTFDQMIDLDIEYIETRSLSNDLRILARTVYVLLFEHNE